MQRREFLKTSALVSGAALANMAMPRMASAATPKNILVLGGTAFLGPQFVNAAIASGHKVTLFNRGITNPELFPHLEKIRGNRSARKEEENLSGLANRDWGAVVDVWPHDPVLAESAARMLGPRTQHYLYVSSVAAYGEVNMPDIDETFPLQSWSSAKGCYGPEKAESERRLNSLLGDKLTIIRPGPIKGERDGAWDLATWLFRTKTGGRHIGPGDGNDAVELVDVKDVGGLMALAVNKRLLGAFNATGRSMTFREFLGNCKVAMASDAEYVWIPREFLTKEGFDLYNGKFFLLRKGDSSPNLFAISSEKAYRAGWQTRTFSETAHDVLMTWDALNGTPPKSKWTDPLPPPQEQQVLSNWEKQSKG